MAIKKSLAPFIKSSRTRDQGRIKSYIMHLVHKYEVRVYPSANKIYFLEFGLGPTSWSAFVYINIPQEEELSYLGEAFLLVPDSRQFFQLYEDKKYTEAYIKDIAFLLNQEVVGVKDLWL